MKILIAGTGDTGVHLAKMLSRENQDVVLMGDDAEVLDDLDGRYNLITYRGNVNSPADLRKAGAPGCDLFIAVTPWQNHNLIACQIAKWLGARRTLARIDSEELLSESAASHFAKLGVDEMVYPEYLAAQEISRTLGHPWLASLYPMHEGQLAIAAVRLTPESPLNGLCLRDFVKEEYRIHICAICRGRDIIIPGGSDTLLAGDMVYFTTPPSPDENELRRLFGRRQLSIRRVIIAGAGKMSVALISALQGRCELTIVDSDRSRCDAIAERFDKVTVVCDDFRDVDTLREEGIASCDAFITLSDSSEKNIVSAMVATGLGARYTVADIEDIQYFAEADNLAIDMVVNKKLITSSTIYQMLLDSDLQSPRCLALESAEVAEIVAQPGSKITRRKVSQLGLKKGVTIAAVIRDGESALVGGDTQILPGDHVIIFCLRGLLNHIQQLFR